MRRIKQLLTMHFGAGASARRIAHELGVAPSTVREYLGRAAAAGISWPLATDVTDESLMAQMFVNAGVRAGARFHAEPDWSALVGELKRPGVNLLVLWEEYRAVHPAGYAYSRFCQLFREFERRLSPTMRQSHVAGHKAFVDYSGKQVPITDPVTGEVHPAEIFVAVTRRIQPDLCRGYLDPKAAGLDWRAHTHVPVLGGGSTLAGAGQSQERHPQGFILRPGGEPQLRHDGGALWGGHSARLGRIARATRRPWRLGCDLPSPTSSAACAMWRSSLWPKPTLLSRPRWSGSIAARCAASG